MTPEEQKYATESVKNIVVACSLIAGGVWAYYTFDARLEAANAAAELDMLERGLMQRPSVNADLAIEVIDAKDDESWYVNTKVKLRNEGNTDVKLAFDRATVHVARPQFKDGSIIGYENPIRTYEIEIPPHSSPARTVGTGGVTILAGQSKLLNHIVQVTAPGLYQVSFSASPSDEERAFRDSVKETETELTEIAVSEFVSISRRQD